MITETVTNVNRDAVPKNHLFVLGHRVCFRVQWWWRWLEKYYV